MSKLTRERIEEINKDRRNDEWQELCRLALRAINLDEALDTNPEWERSSNDLERNLLVYTKADFQKWRAKLKALEGK